MESSLPPEELLRRDRWEEWLRAVEARGRVSEGSGEIGGDSVVMVSTIADRGERWSNLRWSEGRDNLAVGERLLPPMAFSSERWWFQFWVAASKEVEVVDEEERAEDTQVVSLGKSEVILCSPAQNASSQWAARRDSLDCWTGMVARVAGGGFAQ